MPHIRDDPRHTTTPRGRRRRAHLASRVPDVQSNGRTRHGPLLEYSAHRLALAITRRPDHQHGLGNTGSHRRDARVIGPARTRPPRRRFDTRAVLDLPHRGRPDPVAQTAQLASSARRARRSPARRSANARNPARVGGQPGWRRAAVVVHRRATSRRCQRRTATTVTNTHRSWSPATSGQRPPRPLLRRTPARSAAATRPGSPAICPDGDGDGDVPIIR
jgi:hypothetical protein